MRIVLWIFFMAGSLALLAQENVKDAQGRKQGEWGKDYSNGTPKYRGTFKDNKPVGEFLYYWPNGAKKSVLNYQDGGKATAVHYYPNGNKQSEGPYVNQQKDGDWTFYNEDGVMRARESYQKDKKHGITITYFTNGKKASEQHFKEGIQQGEEIRYFENGKVMAKDHYTAGERDGQFVIYNPDGSPSVRGAHSMGEETGKWEMYDSQGMLLKEVYKLEVGADSIVPQNGKHIIYYGNEMPKEIAEYKTGALHGTRELYYDNGRWELVEKVDPRSGDRDTYREMVGHTVKERCRYVYGKKHGTCEYFFEDGGLKRKEEYNMGKLVQ